MAAEGERFGWRWVVAALTPPPEGRLVLLDPALAVIRKRITLGPDAEIDNLLLWIDRGAARELTARATIFPAP